MKFLLLAICLPLAYAFCKKDWISYDEFCYYKPPVTVNYKNALDICAELDSELLTVNSEEEQEIVTLYLIQPSANVWLDALNSEYENWMYEDAEEEMKNKSECAIVMHTRNREAKWTAENCEATNEVVCKASVNRPKPRICPSGWTQVKNKCFLFNLDKNNCEEAEQFCQKAGGHLASIETAEEDKVVSNVLVKKTPASSLMYIGATSFKTPKFHWVDRSKFNYTNWGAGNPRTSVTNGCAFIFAADRMWYNDQPATNAFYSVCSIKV